MTEKYDRVRVNTSDEINREIDESTRKSVEQYAAKAPSEVTSRIEELDHEWSIERTLELNASALALSGLVLGLTVNKKFLAIPGVVLPFLLQHAVQGWCPPLPILRRLGVRTRQEIDREKYALKLLRGDFKNAASAEDVSPAMAMTAVQA